VSGAVGVIAGGGGGIARGAWGTMARRQGRACLAMP
jgi:hypothetical protein